MSKSSFMPLEVVPDWLIESPITFDDLKCTSPPSTIFRMSLPPSPVAERRSAKQRSPTHQRLRQHGYEHEYEFEGRYEHDYPRESMVSIIASSDSESDEDEEEAELVEAKPVSLVRLDLVEEHTPHTQDAQQGPTSPSAKELPPDSQSFLWCDEDVRPDSDSDSDDDDDDATLNEHDREQQETDPSPIDPFFVGPAPGHPSHSQSQSRSRPPSNPKSASPQPKPSSPAPSPAPTHPTPTPTPDTATTVDPRSPWFMHFDAASLAALDNQLLQSPVDAFADLCYAHAVQLAAPSPAAYSWRRFSRLRPLTPFDEESESQSQSQPGGEWGEGSSHLDLAGDAIEERERDQEEEECQCPGEDGDEGDESASDTDSDVLASPEQAELVRQSWGMAGKKGGGGMGLAGRPRVYSPTPGQYPHEHRHARHFHAESDGSIQFGLAGGVRMSQATSPPFAYSPLPPPHTPPPFTPTYAPDSEPHTPTQGPGRSRYSKALPLPPPRSPSPSPFSASRHQLRAPMSLDDLRSATASPPPMFLPSPAVSQAQLAFLFGAPPRPGESVHFFPASAGGAKDGKDGKEGREGKEGKGRPRRGTLRISTATNTTNGSGGWLQRIRAGFSPGA